MTEAVIFDMNGVIVEDEQIHRDAWREFANHHNLELSEEDINSRVSGRTEKEVFEFLYARSITDEELESFSNERITYVIDLFKDRIALPNGLGELLSGLGQAGIKMAVATSARVPYFNFVMDSLSIRSYFQAVVTAEDVEKGKPDPEAYNLAAQKLGVEKGKCIVIEDSLSGVKSGQAAGMEVIAITSTHKRDELSDADYVIDSFAELSIDKILSMIS